MGRFWGPSSTRFVGFTIHPLHAPIQTRSSHGEHPLTPCLQSFAMTKICFQSLPMPQFTTLQKRVFPLYFKLQTGLLAVVVVTHPPMSLVSLINCWWDYVPLGIALGVSALNLVIYGPRTQEVMIERIHQGEINQFLCLPRAMAKFDCKEASDQSPNEILQSVHRS